MAGGDCDNKEKSTMTEWSKFQRQNEIYHFTSIARLPWIAAAGQLQPGRNQRGNFPCDFVWATTNRLGDKTASAYGGYREGLSALVRITLHAEDFESWPSILQRFPQWTAEHVRKLETRARKLGETETGIRCWHARAEPLPLSRVIRVEAKRYSGDWRTVTAADYVAKEVQNDGVICGVALGDDVFVSAQSIVPGLPTFYGLKKFSAQDWAALK
jgi:hypothetical protein